MSAFGGEVHDWDLVVKENFSSLSYQNKETISFPIVAT